jgi:hypothetical protein
MQSNSGESPQQRLIGPSMPLTFFGCRCFVFFRSNPILIVGFFR